jgi:epoxyqueuosine reductase
MKEALVRRALELGFDLCRVTTAAPPASAAQFRQALAEGRHAEMAWLARNADKRCDPQAVLPGARSIVCLAASYAAPADIGRLQAAEPNPAGVIARYARHDDYHEVLAKPLRELAAWIDANAGGAPRSLWYVDTGPILERDLAQRAGVGFVGKHTGLISRQLGNWFLLAEILTTAEIAPDESEQNHCGRCTRCLTACPTGALPAPFTLDARRCISYLTIEHRGPIPEALRPAIGNRIFGCDDCLAVCPWNRFARQGQLLRPHRRPDLDAPALLELLSLDETQFRGRFRTTPLWRTKLHGLRRNVLVALGNVGDDRCLRPLQEFSSSGDELLAEHADWARHQIAGRAMQSGG